MDNAINKMHEYGLNPELPLQYGKIIRFSSGGKRNKDCWYICQVSNDNIYLHFGDWSTGLSDVYSSFEHGKSEKEIERIKKEFKIIRKEAEAQRIKESKEVAIKAQKMWAGLKEGNHPYLKKKKINANGARRYKNSLVIPVYKNGEIVSLQFIDSSGKRFMSGGITSGGAYVIKGEKNFVVVCEGFSTGASIFEATGFQTFISFYADNLCKVASRVKQILPDSKIIIACDNDKYKDFNTGVEKGTKTAEFVNGIIVIPEFKDESSKPTDFNDLHVLEGIDIVKAQIVPKTEHLEAGIREWCSKFKGSFTINEIFNHFGIKDRQQKNKVDDILSLLCKENIIQQDSKRRSVFRVVDSEIRTMKVKRSERVTGVDIVLPFDLSKKVILEDRNIVVIAGESNAGKTAIFLENMKDNIFRSQQFDKPVYISSEMSESEFSNRSLLILDDPDVWNQAEIIDKSTNFQDAISQGRENKLIYIDLLEVSTEISFSDMEANLKQIRDSLKSGVAMVAMQKSKGQRLARGGDGTLSKARLYISLHHCYKGEKGIVNRAVIEKCKMVHNGLHNPEGQQLFYQITKNGGIINVTDWGWPSDIETTINKIKRKNPEVGNSYENFQFLGDYKD